MDIFICGPVTGVPGEPPICINCEELLPEGHPDKTFCSHECAAEHDERMEQERLNGPCTVCGIAKSIHTYEDPDHPHEPFRPIAWPANTYLTTSNEDPPVHVDRRYVEEGR